MSSPVDNNNSGNDDTDNNSKNESGNTSSNNERTENTRSPNGIRLSVYISVPYIPVTRMVRNGNGSSERTSRETEGVETHRIIQMLPQFVIFNNSFGFSGLNDFLNRAFHQHQPTGPPPASKRALESLPQVEVIKDLLQQQQECYICQENFEIGEKISVLPCSHLFHVDCVMKWLKEHNTCPVCRYELETDDEDYERERKRRLLNKEKETEEQNKEKNQNIGVNSDSKNERTARSLESSGVCPEFQANHNPSSSSSSTSTFTTTSSTYPSSTSSAYPSSTSSAPPTSSLSTLLNSASTLSQEGDDTTT